MYKRVELKQNPFACPLLTRTCLYTLQTTSSWNVHAPLFILSVLIFSLSNLVAKRMSHWHVSPDERAKTYFSCRRDVDCTFFYLGVHANGRFSYLQHMSRQGFVCILHLLTIRSYIPLKWNSMFFPHFIYLFFFFNLDIFFRSFMTVFLINKSVIIFRNVCCCQLMYIADQER